ncbi:Excreted virulence factor EspC, type VII ESX diderm [Lentzea fradiae]|uniref:Excreted virulence factor EspC, type VII ESX diderm n=1 Tax=Lentzea fradiae TaxID=200378 RepID=A0A1G7P1V9_9PSEU|nr:type VII secretion target [Lentzea fradiae]SDF79599.1 Excreted virulence factor EspC, type VII ESX diderm [Lentzea fradiae]
MSTPDNFTVDHEQLRGHAATLAGYADQLSATAARMPDRLGQELGSFAQFLAAGLGGAMGRTRTAFGDVASTLDKVSIGVRQTADAYQRTDDGNAASFTGVDR